MEAFYSPKQEGALVSLGMTPRNPWGTKILPEQTEARATELWVLTVNGPPLCTCSLGKLRSQGKIVIPEEAL